MTRISLIVIACLAGLLVTAGWLLKNQIASNSVLRVQLSESQQTLKKYEESQKSVQAVDQHYQQVLSNAKAENDRLNADLAAGRVRLRVAAHCMPVTASTPSGTDDGRPELDPASRPAYTALKAGIIEKEAKIEGLKEYIRTVCK